MYPSSTAAQLWLNSQLCLLSQSLPDGQGDPEQHLRAFKENRVPDLEHRGRRQAGGEDGEEPLHGEDVGERRLVATCNETGASTHSRFCPGGADRLAGFTSGFFVGRFLKVVEMLRESGQLQTQQISEDRHVHWRGEAGHVKHRLRSDLKVTKPAMFT